MGKFIDRTGQRYGKLVVVERAKDRYDCSGRKMIMWTCECNCGNKTVVDSSSLGSRNTKTCGCSKHRKGQDHHSWAGHGEISGHFWANTRNGAKSRNLDFEITMEEAWKIFLDQERKCSLTGIELLFATQRSEETQTASVDRIDSSKGYTIDNVQWVHKDINKIKSDLSQEYFIRLCTEVAEHNLCLQ